MSDDITKFIYCDEHGNTGEKLLDESQPVFALASNDYSKDEALELLDGLISQGAAEAKFKVLRKTPAGRTRLVRFLVDPRLNEYRVAIFLMDKRYMVFTKLVDIVMENILHERGLDLYKQGANLATANMMYYCIPTFCGKEPTEALLDAFVEVVRHRQQEQLENYLSRGAALIRSCEHDETRDFLMPFFSRDLIPEWFPSLPDNAMDPAIPALFKLIDTWGRRKADRFIVVHDESKPIIASEELFLKLMTEANEASKLVGYDRRKFLFPLRAAGLIHGKSTEFPQLQISDVCAGAAAYYVRCKRTDSSDDICDAIEASKLLACIDGGLMPSPHVTPGDLDTDDESGCNPIDPFVQRGS